MQVMKSTFKRNFRLFSFTVKIDVEEANLAVVEEDIFRPRASRTPSVRQRSAWRTICAAPCSPVSYTHLDVYKRQAEGRKLCPELARGAQLETLFYTESAMAKCPELADLPGEHYLVCLLYTSRCV